MRKILLVLLCVFLLAGCALTQPVKKEPKKVVAYVNTINPTNRTVKFMYYIPSSLIEKTTPYPVIVFVPGLNGDGETSVPQEFYKFADENGFAILAPTFKFNMEDFKNQKSYQFPENWSKNALIAMLKKAKENDGLNYSKLYLVGFSAGAQFVSRFSLQRPDLVRACASLASGARVELDRNNGVHYFIGIGRNDDTDRLENARIFKQSCYRYGVPIEYKEYNIGHSTSKEEFLDVLNFFLKVKIKSS